MVVSMLKLCLNVALEGDLNLAFLPLFILVRLGVSSHDLV